MNEADGGNAEKYTLIYYTPDDADTNSPPFKYRTYYLSDAVEGAWRNHLAGGNVVSIVKAERVVLNNDDLRAIFQRLAELIPLTPERPLREIAEQVVQERGKE